MLLTKKVKIKWNNSNKKHYENKGYKYTKSGDEFEANIEDLPPSVGGDIFVKVKCDNSKCQQDIHEITYTNYKKGIKKHDGKYICYNCLRNGLYIYDTYGTKITRNKDGKRICNVDGCNNIHFSKGYCDYHRRKLLPNKKKCIVENCNENNYSLGYCKSHHRIFKRFGYIPQRNRTDPLEIRIHKDYADIVLYNINYELAGYTQVSLEDIERVKQYKWRFGSNGYITGWIEDNIRTLSLHRFIMNDPKNMVVHHKNHIITDNRRENLEICTSWQNSLDRFNIERFNKTGCIGVWQSKRNIIRPWIASIGEVIVGNGGYIGSFETYEQAVYVREIYELYYYNKFSPRFYHLQEKYIYIYEDLMNNGIAKYIDALVIKNK